MTFQTQKRFFNGIVDLNCGNPCLKMKRYESTIDQNSWAKEPQISNFFKEGVILRCEDDFSNERSKKGRSSSARGRTTGSGGDDGTPSRGRSANDKRPIGKENFKNEMNVDKNMVRSLEEKLRAVTKERDELREKTKHLQEFQKKQGSNADETIGRMSQDLVKQGGYIDELVCECEDIKQHYEATINGLMTDKEILENQVCALKEELFSTRCTLHRLECVQRENAFLVNEIQKLECALTQYDIQYKSLMRVIEELGCSAGIAQSDCCDGIDDLANLTAVVVCEIKKRLEDNGFCSGDSSMMENMKEDCEKVCADAINKLRALAEENDKLRDLNLRLIAENKDLAQTLGEHGIKITTLADNLDKLDNDMVATSKTTNEIGRNLNQSVSLVKDIGIYQAKNTELLESAMTVDGELIDNLKRLLLQEQQKNALCQSEKEAISKIAKGAGLQIDEDLIKKEAAAKISPDGIVGSGGGIDSTKGPTAILDVGIKTTEKTITRKSGTEIGAEKSVTGTLVLEIGGTSESQKRPSGTSPGVSRAGTVSGAGSPQKGPGAGIDKVPDAGKGGIGVVEGTGAGASEKSAVSSRKGSVAASAGQGSSKRPSGAVAGTGAADGGSGKGPADKVSGTGATDGGSGKGPAGKGSVVGSAGQSSSQRPSGAVSGTDAAGGGSGKSPVGKVSGTGAADGASADGESTKDAADGKSQSKGGGPKGSGTGTAGGSPGSRSGTGGKSPSAAADGSSGAVSARKGTGAGKVSGKEEISLETDGKGGAGGGGGGGGSPKSKKRKDGRAAASAIESGQGGAAASAAASRKGRRTGRPSSSKQDGDESRFRRSQSKRNLDMSERRRCVCDTCPPTKLEICDLGYDKLFLQNDMKRLQGGEQNADGVNKIQDVCEIQSTSDETQRKSYKNFIALYSLYLTDQLEQGIEMEYALQQVLDALIDGCGFCFCKDLIPKGKFYIICHKILHRGFECVTFKELIFMHEKIVKTAETLKPGHMVGFIRNRYLPETTGKNTCCRCKEELCCNASGDSLSKKISELEVEMLSAKQFLHSLKAIPPLLDATLNQKQIAIKGVEKQYSPKKDYKFDHTTHKHKVQEQQTVQHKNHDLRNLRDSLKRFSELL